MSRFDDDALAAQQDAWRDYLRPVADETNAGSASNASTLLRPNMPSASTPAGRLVGQPSATGCARAVGFLAPPDDDRLDSSHREHIATVVKRNHERIVVEREAARDAAWKAALDSLAAEWECTGGSSRVAFLVAADELRALLTADHAKALDAVKAAAWDEGFLSGNRWAFTDADADAIESNPYRADRHTTDTP